MYRYTSMDKRFVLERVAEFRNQADRRIRGELTEDEFRPLRLMNGLYLQRHAYMLRVNVPYGQLNSAQVRTLGYISERYDRGYAHVTTRQNFQYNWLRLEDVADILHHLALVEMHGIQSSGNCIRNITTDPFAGIADDEVFDVRPFCEIMRQYTTLHPEFMYLPRKFKLAFTGSIEDRAAISIHDIGYRARIENGQMGFRVLVGGGLGRTPRIGQIIREFIPVEDLLSYTEAIVRVYNLHGRRDNKYKARIKILVGAMGIDAFRTEVDAEWELVRNQKLSKTQIDEMTAFFDDVTYDDDAAADPLPTVRQSQDLNFDRWMTYNVRPHKKEGYHAVYVSLKHPQRPPGDIITEQFYALADLMDEFSQGLCATTYSQNMLLQYVRRSDLETLYDALQELQLATPNIGTLADMICCPGLDFCSLASASSIPVAAAINERFKDLDEIYDLGPISIKMSGCINACGHHHVGDIGILGIDKRGVEFYQVAIGGSPGSLHIDEAQTAQILGPAVSSDKLVDLLDRLLDCYRHERQDKETFLETINRAGVEPFKSFVYPREDTTKVASGTQSTSVKEVASA